MALLPLLTYPHPLLRQKAHPVTEITPQIQHLIEDMFETMYLEDRGIGLAATQVGVLKRVLVMDLSEEGQKRQPLAVINPEITWMSEASQTLEEACLSLPGQAALVTRPDQVMVTYQDRQGTFQKIEGTGLMASCLQHEIDHLNGMLFPERIPALKRTLLYARVLKKVKHLSRTS